MEVLLKGVFIGATKRTFKPKDGGAEKTYADLHVGVSMRQGPGAVGNESRTYRMEPSLFEKLRNVPLYSAVVITCDESEYTREGGAVETVKLVVDVTPEQKQRAA